MVLSRRQCEQCRSIEDQVRLSVNFIPQKNKKVRAAPPPGRARGGAGKPAAAELGVVAGVAGPRRGRGARAGGRARGLKTGFGACLHGCREAAAVPEKMWYASGVQNLNRAAAFGGLPYAIRRFLPTGDASLFRAHPAIGVNHPGTNFREAGGVPEVAMGKSCGNQPLSSGSVPCGLPARSRRIFSMRFSAAESSASQCFFNASPRS